MKIIKSLLLLIIVSLSLSASTLVLAANDDAKATIDGLNSAASKVGAYADQTTKLDARSVILEKVGGFVGLALSFVGIVFLLLIIWAGLQWMTAQGNSSQVDKAKDLMINAVIGLIIVSAAYSITIFFGREFIK
jgi:hypothetical protein